MATLSIQTPHCMVCGEQSLLFVEEHQYNSWKSGTLIQNAFPNLTPDERELLMTGTHPKCWEEMFDDEE